MQIVKQWFGGLRRLNEPQSNLEILRKTPYAELDRAVSVMIRSQSREEVRKAMVELIKEAPIDDFHLLKRVYFKHFAE